MVPTVIHGGINPSPPCPSHGGYPHAPASVVSLLASAAPPLHPLTHQDLSASSALDLTMSFWPSSLVAVAPLVVPSANEAPPLAPNPDANVSPPPAPNPNVSPPSPVEGAILPAAAIAPVLLIHPTKPFKLLPIADSKAYLNLTSIIQYYLRCPEFSTQQLDNALVTDLRNAEASFWEGLIWVAVQEGLLRFLIENKSSMYDGKGFEMLDALNQHCRPDSIENAFTTLLSLFNDNMGELEEIMAFHSCFDGMVNNMA